MCTNRRQGLLSARLIEAGSGGKKGGVIVRFVRPLVKTGCKGPEVIT
jgi:hypothetical protein